MHIYSSGSMTISGYQVLLMLVKSEHWPHLLQNSSQADLAVIRSMQNSATQMAEGSLAKVMQLKGKMEMAKRCLHISSIIKGKEEIKSVEKADASMSSEDDASSSIQEEIVENIPIRAKTYADDEASADFGSEMGEDEEYGEMVDFEDEDDMGPSSGEMSEIM